MKKIIIKGIKGAVGEYKRANSGGWLSPWYGCMMLDREDGQVWTDTFYNLGHNEWKEYHSQSIICLSKLMNEMGIEINMRNTREMAEQLCRKWAAKEAC